MEKPCCARKKIIIESRVLKALKSFFYFFCSDGVSKQRSKTVKEMFRSAVRIALRKSMSVEGLVLCKSITDSVLPEEKTGSEQLFLGVRFPFGMFSYLELRELFHGIWAADGISSELLEECSYH